MFNKKHAPFEKFLGTFLTDWGFVLHLCLLFFIILMLATHCTDRTQMVFLGSILVVLSSLRLSSLVWLQLDVGEVVV